LAYVLAYDGLQNAVEAIPDRSETASDLLVLWSG
jgi:hypothetical protein